MRIRVSIKRMCAGCKVVRKNNRVYIYCSKNPRHKQRQPYTTVSDAVASRPGLAFAAQHQLAAMGLPTQPLGALLAHRQTSCLGQLYWLAESQGQGLQAEGCTCGEEAGGEMEPPL